MESVHFISQRGIKISLQNASVIYGAIFFEANKKSMWKINTKITTTLIAF